MEALIKLVRKTLFISYVLSGLVVLNSASDTLAHSGGTDANGCHAGSQPYHCHGSSSGSSSATVAAPTTSTTVAPTTSTTVAPTTVAPTTVAPTTVAPIASRVIICYKGKLSKKVKGVNPKCPNGWKKK